MTPTWVVDRVESDLDGFHLGPVGLTIPPASAVAVLGASGAGKTTLLRTLAGFVPVRRGRILRDGQDISSWLPEERNLGYVPQGLGLLPHRTVEGNVRYPLELRGAADTGARARELLDRFGLGRLARRYPTRLSGGEQQRVAIARALAASPELIVWDEPWQGLDVLARHDLGVVLEQLRETERVPVVVVTHDPGLAFSVADTFLVLSEGRVREQGDAASLLRAPSDPFAARFVGFENVFPPAELIGGTRGSLRTWLLERAGPEGIAFAAPSLPVGPGPGATWSGRVRAARPSPHGFAIELVSDDLTVHLRLPGPIVERAPALGTTIGFAIDPTSLHPLGRRVVASPEGS